jgi:FPC/CPF motif-containing protein YcgG
MEKEEKYSVRSSTFMGTNEYSGKIIGYTYEITFNKSLEHTGRFKGIEDGLNDYVKKEKRTNFYTSLVMVWHSFVALIRG